MKALSLALALLLCLNAPAAYSPGPLYADRNLSELESPSTALTNLGVTASAAQLNQLAATLTASRAMVTNGSGVASSSAVTATELGYLGSVTSAIQTQLNAKAPAASPTFSGTITTPLTASRVLTTNGSSELAASAVTTTTLGYLDATSSIQTQIDTKAPAASPTITGTAALPIVTVSGDLTGDGGDQLVGFLQNQVASTSVAITAAQCGTTFVSNSADVMVLPEASTVLGCRLTFVCGTADDFDVNPADGTDVIGTVVSVTGTNTTTVLAPAAGDAIRCTDVGSSIVLEAVGANLWASIGGANGIWTDVD